MRSIFVLSSAALLASSFLLLSEAARKAFREPLNRHDNFVIPDGSGPDRWGCTFQQSAVKVTNAGTRILIGKDSASKPFSCGELIYGEEGLSYGVYSIDMIASNVVGQVTSFFLIANEDSEIDIEITGLNSHIGWMNIWHAHKQHPISIDLGFDASEGWHTYQFEWRKDFVEWSVDGKVILHRTDIPTTPPSQANYRLAINSWTQVNQEKDIQWAGQFKMPTDGRIPQAMFRNIQYRP
ncbi:hypothetical protein BGZ67_008074 [Mortierella alpina]|nr:hypothetical protein BGZ67_008074 [Mortierella alpina]